MLVKALKNPAARWIAVEVESAAFAEDIATHLISIFRERMIKGIILDETETAQAFLQNVHELYPEEPNQAKPAPILLTYPLVSQHLSSEEELAEAKRFWQEMNQCRETIAHKKLLWVLMLPPAGYDRLLRYASHLHRWFASTLHLFPPPEESRDDTRAIDMAFPNETGASYEALAARMESLEAGLREARERGRSEPYLLRNYYLPLFYVAVQLRHLERAKSLLDQINEADVPADDQENFYQFQSSFFLFAHDLEAAEHALQNLENVAADKGRAYQLKGFLYQEQRQWEKALENYQQALKANTDSGQLHEIGGTYHQIGRVYEEQRQWEQALENYQQALKAFADSDQLHEIGGTYHQIGVVYQMQRQWEQALENYQQALKAKTDSGQLHQLGSTYHQIGMVYGEQRQWEKALENYQQALKAKTDSGQLHQLGSTYACLMLLFSDKAQDPQYAAPDDLEQAAACARAAHNTLAEHQPHMLVVWLRHAYRVMRQFPDAQGEHMQALRSHIESIFKEKPELREQLDSEDPESPDSSQPQTP